MPACSIGSTPFIPDAMTRIVTPDARSCTGDGLAAARAAHSQAGSTQRWLRRATTASKSRTESLITDEVAAWQVRQAPTRRILRCSSTVNGRTSSRAESIPALAPRDGIQASAGSPAAPRAAEAARNAHRPPDAARLLRFVARQCRMRACVVEREHVAAVAGGAPDRLRPVRVAQECHALVADQAAFRPSKNDGQRRGQGRRRARRRRDQPSEAHMACPGRPPGVPGPVLSPPAPECR